MIIAWVCYCLFFFPFYSLFCTCPHFVNYCATTLEGTRSSLKSCTHSVCMIEQGNNFHFFFSFFSVLYTPRVYTHKVSFWNNDGTLWDGSKRTGCCVCITSSLRFFFWESTRSRNYMTCRVKAFSFLVHVEWLIRKDDRLLQGRKGKCFICLDRTLAWTWSSLSVFLPEFLQAWWRFRWHESFSLMIIAHFFATVVSILQNMGTMLFTNWVTEAMYSTVEKYYKLPFFGIFRWNIRFEVLQLILCCRHHEIERTLSGG